MGDSRRWAADRDDEIERKRKREYEHSPEGRLKKGREQYLEAIAPLMEALAVIKQRGIVSIKYDPTHSVMETEYAPHVKSNEDAVADYCDWLYVKAMKENGFTQQEIDEQKETMQ